MTRLLSDTPAPQGVQQEVVDALTKMDNPHSANNAAANNAEQGGDGCCTIL
jgi:hypothetical protein